MKLVKNTDNNKELKRVSDQEAEQAFKTILSWIGEDPNREGLKRTPHRVSKAWQYFSKGYNQDLDTIVNNAIFKESSKDMVVVRDVEFFSLCEHHLLP